MKLNEAGCSVWDSFRDWSLLMGRSFLKSLGAQIWKVSLNLYLRSGHHPGTLTRHHHNTACANPSRLVIAIFV